MRRALAALSATACLLLVAGCSDDEPEATPSPAPAPSPTEITETPTEPAPETPTETAAAPTEDAGQVIDVTFESDDVTPNGDRIEATVGEPIELRVSADVAGEIHVHSSPEQELEYDAGESTLTLTIDQPGIVEVESHDLDKVIMQLEVRP